MKVVYIAGPFRGTDGWMMNCNVHRAEEAARGVAVYGAAPLTPHSIGAHMHGSETAEFWVEATLELMRRADAVLVLPGYEKSSGTLGEIAEAKRLGIVVFLPLESLPDFASLRRWLGSFDEPPDGSR